MNGKKQAQQVESMIINYGINLISQLIDYLMQKKKL
jgi:hypothetical protein